MKIQAKTSISLLILAALATPMLIGCGSDDDDQPAAASPTPTPSPAPTTTPAATTESISIRFAGYAGSNPVSCDTQATGLGTGSVTASIKDFRFYLSNVRLLARDGAEVPLVLPANDDWHLTVGDDRVTLIDLENGAGACSAGTAATNADLVGTVPVGDYVGVAATMGVPFALNHSDYATASAPLDSQAMAWSWQSGRKFAKIEVTDPAGANGSWSANTFNFHLGSTGCVGNPANGETVSCTVPNRMDFEFAAFDPATQQVAVDIVELLKDNDVTVNQSGAAGCMSGGTDPECDAVFDALSIDWKPDGTGSGQPIDGGSGQRAGGPIVDAKLQSDPRHLQARPDERIGKVKW